MTKTFLCPKPNKENDHSNIYKQIYKTPCPKAPLQTKPRWETQPPPPAPSLFHMKFFSISTSPNSPLTSIRASRTLEYVYTATPTRRKLPNTKIPPNTHQRHRLHHTPHTRHHFLHLNRHKRGKRDGVSVLPRRDQSLGISHRRISLPQ